MSQLKARIRIKEQERTAELVLTGEIHWSVCSEVCKMIFLVCNEKNQTVIVDLSQVGFMDSSGVATLIEGLKWSQQQGRQFFLRNVGVNVRNALSLTKVEGIFQFIDDKNQTACHGEPGPGKVLGSAPA